MPFIYYKKSRTGQIVVPEELQTLWPLRPRDIIKQGKITARRKTDTTDTRCRCQGIGRPFISASYHIWTREMGNEMESSY